MTFYQMINFRSPRSGSFALLMKLISMEQRINAYATGNKTVNTLHQLGQQVSVSGLDPVLLELLYYRASQINGCALCLHVHSRNLRARGETEQRIYTVNAWRDTPLYSAKERSALAWTEALTEVKGGLVPDPLFEDARKHFSETELIDLTMAIVAVNGYNRINIAFGVDPGAF